MTLSDLTKYSMTRKIARPLCDSFEFLLSFMTHERQEAVQARRTEIFILCLANCCCFLTFTLFVKNHVCYSDLLIINH